MIREDKDFGTICAVMVTYNAPPDFINGFESVIRQVAHVVVVDNGSDAETISLLKTLQERHGDKMEVHHNTKNNLALAQNIGIRRALQQNYGWVLLMDHDSIPAEDMVEQMLQAWQRRRDRKRIGIVAPVITITNSEKVPAYVMPYMGFLFRRARFDAQPVLTGVLDVIASGSLIQAAVFEKVGYMDESFVIDYVDKDFCMRLRKMGFLIMVVRQALLYHRLGECMDCEIMGMHITASNHSPERRYFITRNRVRTWGRYMTSSPSYVIHDIIASKFDMLRILFCESQKLEKMKAILRGMKDALLRH